MTHIGFVKFILKHQSSFFHLLGYFCSKVMKNEDNTVG